MILRNDRPFVFVDGRREQDPDPPIWGALADRAGYSAMFVCAGLVLILGTASFLVVLRRERVPGMAELNALEEG